MGRNENSSNDTKPAMDNSKTPTQENVNSPSSHDSSMRHRALSSRRIRRWSKLFRAEFKALRKSVEHLNERVQILSRDYFRCVKIVKDCQEETASVLNRELERHALHPAVLIVVTLADELLRLNNRAQATELHAKSSSELKRLRDELQISASIANDKLGYLDIARIAPSKGDSFDPEKHVACSSVPTDKKNLHGTISELLTAGIRYRSKVLQQARVSMFRYVQVEDSIQEKGAKDEET